MVKSLKSSRRRGVDAIFTSPRRKHRNILQVVGTSGIVAGIAVIIVSKLGERLPAFFLVSDFTSSGSLILASLGLLFLTSGAGICLVDLASDAHAKRGAKPQQLDAELFALEQIRSQTKTSSFEERNLNVRLSLIAFFQGCLLLSLFAGLVGEYESNLTMQEWVRSSFGFGQVLLTWQAVLASSFLMGLLTVYCLLGQDLAL